MEGDYQFDDLDTSSAAPSPSSSGGNGFAQSGHGNYANEIYSKQIKAKFRTFYVDLKESSNGKFLKISEKSRGQKNTIMMDAEDIPMFMEALKEVSEKL